jgi:hypothetical protein
MPTMLTTYWETDKIMTLIKSIPNRLGMIKTSIITSKLMGMPLEISWLPLPKVAKLMAIEVIMEFGDL